jgi:hypothetical protein
MSTTQSQENARGFTSQNSAKVYVMRPSSINAAAINSPVYVNGQYIGRIGNKGHLSWIVSPGQTTVTSTKGLTLIEFDRHLKHKVTFNAQAGKIYFVRLTIPWGFGLEPSPEFLLLDEQSGRALLKKVS